MAREHSNYIFHFWLVRADKELAVLDREMIIKKAPKNEGRWEKFKIPFKAYKDNFNTRNIRTKFTTLQK